MPVARVLTLSNRCSRVITVGGGTQSSDGGTIGAPPNVTTFPVTSISGTGATLNGEVNPNNLSTQVRFIYGRVSTGNFPGNTPWRGIGQAGTPITVQEPITGLEPTVQYHCKLVASNSLGTVQGAVEQWQQGVGDPPQVSTGSATNVGRSSASLDGNCTPGSTDATAKFRYRIQGAPAYTDTADQDVPADTVPVALAVDLSGLQSDKVYEYYLTASNLAGQADGQLRTFQTGIPTSAPDVNTLAASSITTTAATLNATVLPGGLSTLCWFEWGVGNFANQTTQQTFSGSSITGFQANLATLAPSTLYQGRAMAQNALGIDTGNTITFTTNAVPVQNPPTIFSLQTTSVTQTLMAFSCNVNPNGAATTFSGEVRRLSGTVIYTFASQALGSGSVNVPVTDTTTNVLAPSTNYLLVVFADNSGGTATTSIGFTTGSGVPEVTNVAAASITDTSAVIQGTVDANTLSTTYWFDWGISPNLTQSTPSQAVTGNTPVPVNFQLTNLTALTVYVFRVQAQNVAGSVAGTPIQSFSTADTPAQQIPTVTISSPTGVTSTTASLAGTVNPQGAATLAHFVVRDVLTGLDTFTGSDINMGSGTIALSAQDVATGLTEGRDYFAILFATNSGGTNSAATGNFTTPTSSGGNGLGTQNPPGNQSTDVECNPWNPSLGFVTETAPRDFTYVYSSAGAWFDGLTYNCRIYEATTGVFKYQLRTSAAVTITSAISGLATAIRNMTIGDVLAFEPNLDGSAPTFIEPSGKLSLGGGNTTLKGTAYWPNNKPITGIAIKSSDPAKRLSLYIGSGAVSSTLGGFNGIYFKDVDIYTDNVNGAFVGNLRDPTGMIGLYNCKIRKNPASGSTIKRALRLYCQRFDIRDSTCQPFTEQFVYSVGTGHLSGLTSYFLRSGPESGFMGRAVVKLSNRIAEVPSPGRNGPVLIKDCNGVDGPALKGGSGGGGIFESDGNLAPITIENCRLEASASSNAAQLASTVYDGGGGPCGASTCQGQCQYFNYPWTEADGYANTQLILKGNTYVGAASTSSHHLLSSTARITIYDTFTFTSGSKTGFDLESEDFGSVSHLAGTHVRNQSPTDGHFCTGSVEYTTPFDNKIGNGIVEWIKTGATAPASVTGWAGLSGSKFTYRAGGAAPDYVFTANQINGIDAPPSGSNYVVVDQSTPYTAAGAQFQVSPASSNSNIWGRVCRTPSGWAFAWELSKTIQVRFFDDTPISGALTPIAPTYTSASVKVSNQTPLNTPPSEYSDEPDISCDIANGRVLVCHNDRTGADGGNKGPQGGEVMGIFGRVFSSAGVAQSPTTSHFLNPNPDYSQWRPIANPNYTSGGWSIGYTTSPGSQDSKFCLVSSSGASVAGDTRLNTADGSNHNGDPAVATNDTGRGVAVYHAEVNTINANGTKEIQFRLVSAINAAVIGSEQAFSSGVSGAGENEMRIDSGGSGIFWAVWHSGPGPMEDARSVWAAILQPNQLQNNVSVIKAPFQVSASTASFAGNPEVAVTGAGKAIVTWRELVSGFYVIKARAFKADGSPDGVEFQVSTSGATTHYVYPDVSTKTDGTRVVFAYHSQDAAGGGIVHPGGANGGTAASRDIYARVFDR